MIGLVNFVLSFFGGGGGGGGGGGALRGNFNYRSTVRQIV